MTTKIFARWCDCVKLGETVGCLMGGILLPALAKPAWLSAYPSFADVEHARRRLTQRQQAWVVRAASLTKKLQSIEKNAFSVKVLRESWCLPSADEGRLLGIPLRQRVWGRWVSLQLHDESLILAKSLMPGNTLKCQTGHLSRLGSKSLGGILFKHGQAWRSGLQVRQWQQKHMLQAGFPPALVPSQVCWGRRSVFRLQDEPLLVNEIFLDNAYAYA